MQVKYNSSRPIARRFSGAMATVILCVVLLGIFVVCAYAAWQKVGPRVLASAEYYVGPQQIEITPRPDWIRNTDLQADVFQFLSRQGPLRIMDDDLAERVAVAFAGHPWVAKVIKVSKQYPATLKVDLIYRKPVCMVEIAGGLMPVDIEATLLPRDDFSPVEAAKYPRLVGVDRGPAGLVGSRWGDSRVVGGAEIAGQLLPLWETLKLQYIVPRTEDDQKPTVPFSLTQKSGQFPPAEPWINAGLARPEIAARSGDCSFDIIAGKQRIVRIIWGRPPGSNAPDELAAQEKLKKLAQFFAEHGSLDYPQGPKELDLRR